MQKVIHNFFSQANINQLRKKHETIMLEARDRQLEGDIEGFALKILEADALAQKISQAKIMLHDN